MKQALILTADQFEDMELFFPIFRLLEAGWKVTVAAPQRTEIHGENGYSLMPDKTFDQVKAEEFDLLVIPGGSPDGAPTTVRNQPLAVEITKSFFQHGKPVAAICHGPYTLVTANVVKGKHLTSYWHDQVPEQIKAAGGIWEDKEVVVDGNLVTSRYPMDLPAFMREVMKLVER